VDVFFRIGIAWLAQARFFKKNRAFLFQMDISLLQQAKSRL
jgi:hypothetical protein